MHRPTYTYSRLIQDVPKACLDELKEMLSTVTGEQELYQSTVFTNILLLLNRRAVELITGVKRPDLSF